MSPKNYFSLKGEIPGTMNKIKDENILAQHVLKQAEIRDGPLALYFLCLINKQDVESPAYDKSCDITLHQYKLEGGQFNGNLTEI